MKKICGRCFGFIVTATAILGSLGGVVLNAPEAKADHCSRFDLSCPPSHRGTCSFSGGDCSGNSDIPTQPRLPRNYTINYQNSTNATIRTIRVRLWNGNDSSWSGDLLGQHTLAPGSYLPVPFDDRNGCHYDLYATLANGASRFVNDFNACTAGTLYIR